MQAGQEHFLGSTRSFLVRCTRPNTDAGLRNQRTIHDDYTPFHTSILLRPHNLIHKPLISEAIH